MSFCPGISDIDGCAACPDLTTQHPCMTAKIQYWRNEGPLQLAKSAVPSRYRGASGRKAIPEGQETPAPAGMSEGSIALDHAIPTDDRGLPFLGENGDPLTAKEYRDKRSHFDGERKKLASQTSR